MPSYCMLTLSYDEVMTLGNEGAYMIKLLANINEARALEDEVIRHHADA